MNIHPLLIYKYMSGIMVLKYKKTLRIVSICIICWLYALAFAALLPRAAAEAESIGRNTAKTALLRLSISGTNAARLAPAAALPENEATVHRLTIGLFLCRRVGEYHYPEPAIEADGTAGTLAVERVSCAHPALAT